MTEDPNSYAARSRAAYSQIASGQQHISSTATYSPVIASSSTTYPSSPFYRFPASSSGPTSTNTPFSSIPYGGLSATDPSTTVAVGSTTTADTNSVTYKIEQEAYLMKKAMDKPCKAVTEIDDNISAVISHCCNMLGELVLLQDVTPKGYYEVHTKILDQMPYVEDYFLSLPLDTQGLVTVQDLYVIAQYCPKVIQRSYLHIAAGCALLKSKERVPNNDELLELSTTTGQQQQQQNSNTNTGTIASIAANIVTTRTNSSSTAEVNQDGHSSSSFSSSAAKDILTDLLDSVKGVQCPLRGLFLRHYLILATRDKLPDRDSPYGTNVEDSYHFILQNLEEMSMLWIRMQQMNTASDKAERKRRERERSELRILVGSNLERLSQLEGVTKPIYKNVILPRILAQILKCDDTLAQAYLMDCVVQVFPDEFHMETLELLLDVLPKLKEKVNVKNIVQNVMDRLAHYNKLSTTDQPQKLQLPSFDAFELFDKCIRQIIIEKGDKIGLKEIIRLQSTLLEFSLNYSSGNLARVNQCLEDAAKALSTASSAQVTDPTVAEQLESLLTVPVKSLGLRVLDLHRYADLLSYVSVDHRKHVSLSILKMVDTKGGETALRDVDRVEQLYSILSPVIRDEMPTEGEGVTIEDKLDAYIEEQELVARLVYMLHSDDTDTLFKMYAVARKHLSQGGKSTLHTTLTPLIFCVLTLIFRVHALELPPPIAISMEKKEDKKETVEEKDEKVEQQQQPQPSRLEGLVDDSGDFMADGNPEVKTEDIMDTIAAEKAVAKDTGPSTAPENFETKSLFRTDDLFTALPSITEESFRKSINCRKLFVFLQKIITSLSPQYPELTFKLYLESAMAADKCAMLKARSDLAAGKEVISISTAAEVAPDSLFKDTISASADFGSISYEFICQAFSIYEDEINDSKAQVRSISSMISCLVSCNMLEKGDYEALITKTAQSGARLVKKSDQCKIILLCSHLFYRTSEDDSISPGKLSCCYRNPQRVLECLQRSLKIADGCMTSSSSANLQLFIDILEQYVYFFEKENPAITDTFVSRLIALINELIDSTRDYSDASIQAQSHYRHILHYIAKKKQSSESASAGRFSLIVT